ncbi:MAG: dihydrodipicolinate reductase [Paracoccaceae bacterium]
MKPLRFLATAVAAATIAGDAAASGFSQVTERSDFVALVEGKQLARFGIRLDVMPEGQIGGRAFGRDVSGAWTWEGGYFCRDLFFGGRDLGPNCQVVQIDGRTIRFVADRGTGDHADFRLDQP